MLGEWAILIKPMHGHFDFGMMNAAMEGFGKEEEVITVAPVEGAQGEVQPFERFVVREGWEKAFFEQNMYEMPHLVAIEELNFFEVEAICHSSKWAKRWMLKQKEIGGQVMFGVLSNYALSMIMVHLMSSKLCTATGRAYNKLVMVKIIEAVFNLILVDMRGDVTPDQLNPLVALFGVDVYARVRGAQCASDVWGDTYPEINQLLAQVDVHVRVMNLIRVTGGFWQCNLHVVF